MMVRSARSRQSHPMRPAMFWHQGDTRSDPWPDSDPTGHNGPHNISARIRAPASATRRNRLMRKRAQEGPPKPRATARKGGRPRPPSIAEHLLDVSDLLLDLAAN